MCPAGITDVTILDPTGDVRVHPYIGNPIARASFDITSVMASVTEPPDTLSGDVRLSDLPRTYPRMVLDVGGVLDGVPLEVDCVRGRR